MRLFLSSEGFGNHADKLLELVGENKRVAFIDNAKDVIDAEQRAQHVEEKRQDFENLGFDFEELDLRDYFHQNQDWIKYLSRFGLIWASGGNTFVLRRAMRMSGLDESISKWVSKDKIVYGGSSAGSILATPSLKGTELGDDSLQIPDGYQKDVIWQGLNLVPFHIVPHYGSAWFAREAELMSKYLEDKKLSYRTLMDGQVIVVQNGHESLLK